MLSNGLLALLITFALAIAWLRLVDWLAQRGWIEGRLSRKIIHTGTGPLFVLCWLLFPSDPASRFLAALVPLAITIQFFLVGMGVLDDPAAVQAMSRRGDRREILRGPLLYGLIFTLLTLVYWKDSPVGLAALMALSGGDGLADIAGRRFGAVRLPWNRDKSWAGSLGMLLGSLVFTAGVLAVFLSVGVFPGMLRAYLPGLALMALAATLVETLPIHDFDNLTVTLAALAVGHLIIG